MTSALVLQLFSLASLVLASEGVIKRWRQNTNYDNPDNWNIGRLPCDGDKLAFPAVSPPIFLEQDVKVVSLELPMTGELVFGEGASITAMQVTAARSSTPATTADTDTCSQGKGQTVEFVRTNYFNWLEPDNWCEAETDTAGCLEDQPPKLDTERVPCIHDDVVFPRDSTFLVRQNYTNSDLKIKSLSIQGQTLTQDSLADFLGTNEGKKQFDFSEDGKPQITEESCVDVTGCACGNDKGMLMHTICEYQAAKCPPLYCQTPVMPKGHCCQICGSILMLDYRYGFKFKTLQKKIKERFISVKNGKVSAIISKLSSDRIQVVVQDIKKDGAEAKQSGEKIKEYIEQDIRGPQKLGLNSVSLQASGTPINPDTGKPNAAKVYGGKSKSAGSIAGIVVTILLVLVLIGAAMFCFVDRGQCRRRMKLPLALRNPFRRYSSDDKSALEMDDSISYVDIMKAQGEENTFDNPMYNMPGSSGSADNQGDSKDKEAKVLNNNEGPAIMDPSSVTFVKTDKNPDGGTSFANPLFGSYQGNPSIIDPNLRFNPVYSDDGIEEDSHI